LDHPAEFIERFPGEVITLSHMPPPMEVQEGDMFFSDNSSPGGLGDPIERAPMLQKADLDNGLTNVEISRNIYCIEANYNEKEKEWKIDEDGTAKLRDEKRKQRLSRGVPVKQWWQKSRKRLLDKDLDPLLVEMYQSSMKLSENFTREFKDFWGLPDDFSM
jgi:acetone carboxylase alpha subunit